ncbi:MAG: hypothetical protein FJ030_08600 [Chloroflexi bacterium]|nr:hypothetical protein [Chloroflexota bacterium]
MNGNSPPTPSKSASFDVEEIGGAQFDDLTEAQRAALPLLAADITTALRALIASGALAVRDGRVTVCDNKSS